MKMKTTRYLSKFIYCIFIILGMGISAHVHAEPEYTNNLPILVTGTVTSAHDGSTLPGVTVRVKDSDVGTATDFDGYYEIEAPADGILVFSYVGYSTVEIPVDARTTIHISLEESAEALEEIVVTALGIRRDEKSLGYSVGRIDGEEIDRVARENVLSALAGKVAGVSISNTGGAGSSVNMVIRGATSLSTDNQPLFVIDGIPVSSSINNVGGFGNDNRVDYGNAIADLDPSNIESISILKGPSAAALYGTRAGNGVVLITTKKARDGQPMQVSVTSNTVFDIPSNFINAQTQFSTGFFSFRPENVGSGILPPISAGDGTGNGPENDKGYWAVQWHSPLDANGVPVPIEVRSYPNNIRNFLNDYALTTTNGMSISNSGRYLNYRLGFTNMTHSGLIPNSDLNRNNLSLAASSNMNDKFIVSTNINFSNTFADNRPSSNRGTNPLQWAYNHPANIDIRLMKDYGSGNDIKRVSGNHENPYFLAYDVNNSLDRYRLYGNVSATWNIIPNLSLTGQFTLNKSDDTRESKLAPGYTQEPNNGAYGIRTSNGLERNINALLTYGKDWNNFTLSASVGGNLLYSKGASSSVSSKNGSGLVVPNVFTINNIQSGALNYSNSRSERAINSLYGMATLGFFNTAYLDFTARNDWSSTLPSHNRSYFYPSVSLSLLLDQIINMGQDVDMFKLRGGWAQVGNDTDPYRLIPTYASAGQWGNAIQLSKPSGLLSPNLLPEEATSIEFGADLIMFSDRLRLEATYYTTDNRNQILGVPLAASTGFSGIQINSGLLQSEGYEFLLGVTPIRTSDWRWDMNFNFTKNETIIVELTDEVEFIEFWDQARVKNIGYVKNEAAGHDGRIGNLYSRKIQRVTDPSSEYYGFPILGSGLDAEWMGEEEYSKVGNYNPDFILGMMTSLSFKGFSLNMTFDWRKGGQFVSQTMRYLSESVHTQTWLDELVHPGELGGKPSDALRQWVLDNKEQLLLADKLRPVGGPTPEYGGFPESFSGVTVYDGTFAPGVFGYHDESGKFVLQGENLGNEGTIFLPYVVSYPWDIGQANMFDADYIKLREISLNYQFPTKWTQNWGLSDINVSFFSRNIMLWAKDADLGVDPERAYQAESSGRFLQGVERYNVDPWVVPIGIKLGLTF